MPHARGYDRQIHMLPGSRWSRVTPEEAIAYHVRDDAKAKLEQRPMDCLLICLVAEKVAAELGDTRWAVTLPMCSGFAGNRYVKSVNNIGKP